MKTANVVSKIIEEREDNIKGFLKSNLRDIFWSKIVANSRQKYVQYDDMLSTQIDKLVDVIFDSMRIDNDGIGHYDAKTVEPINRRLEEIVDSAPEEIMK